MGVRDAYLRMGRAIGSHMAPLSLSCVAAGVLFPQVLGPVELVVGPMFALITFQGALANTFGRVADAFRRPGALLATLFVSSVLMPCLACALGTLLFGASPQIVCGIVLEYSVPVAVISVMWVDLYGGNPALGVAAVLVSTLLSPVTIPVGMHLLLGRVVRVDVAGMMVDMLLKIALPALSATVANDRSGGRAARGLSPALAPACRAMMLLVIAANATNIAPFVRNLTPELVAVVAFIGCFSATGYAWGLAAARLLRRDRADSVTLCYDCGMRNINAGAVIAAAYFPAEVMFPVMMGTLFQQVTAAAFGSLAEAGRIPLGPPVAPASDPASDPDRAAGPASSEGSAG